MPTGGSSTPLSRIGRQGCADLAAAEEFLLTFYDAHPEAGSLTTRLAEVRRSIAETGTYWHTGAELAYGARLALRDSGWCTSGVPWQRVQVRDLRGLRNAAAIASECFEHLRLATNAGRIQPMITVFAPDTPGWSGPRLWNEQVVRYAGYSLSDGGVLGDARNRALTSQVMGLGWKPPAERSRFDHLPLVVETHHEGVKLVPVPRDVVQEVPLEHPEYRWFGELGLRWHTVPLVSDMQLRIGGLSYPAAPFNTWFVGTEIGTRGLAGETAYDIAGQVADRLGLDTSAERSLWRDRATVEINRAVLHSFDSARVVITDHHSEAPHRAARPRSGVRGDGSKPCFTRSRDSAGPDGATGCEAPAAPARPRYDVLARMNRRCLGTDPVAD